MEMMANHKENVKKYPQIAYAFEAYGRIRGSASAGMFPVGVGLMRVIPIESAIDGGCILGLGSVGDRMLILLDIEKLMSGVDMGLVVANE